MNIQLSFLWLSFCVLFSFQSTLSRAENRHESFPQRPTTTQTLDTKEVETILDTFKERTLGARTTRAADLGIKESELKTPIIDFLNQKDSNGNYSHIEFIKDNLPLLRDILNKKDNAEEAYLLLSKRLANEPLMKKEVEAAVIQAQKHSTLARLVSKEDSVKYILYIMQGTPENIPILYRSTFVEHADNVKRSLVATTDQPAKKTGSFFKGLFGN